VGHGQLHEKLRGDLRVVVRERLNARLLCAADLPEACSVASVDVSFISLALILPALRAVLTNEADVVALVKPQFEVGRAQVGRGGLVKDPALHLLAVRSVAAAAQAAGYAVVDACASPIAGSEGNREFFLHLAIGSQAQSAPDLDERLARAVAP